MFRMRNQINLSQLHPHPLNPRKHLDIEELADSIKVTGLLSPVIVRRIGFDKFQIISGHRRKAALEMLGEKYADCDVVEMTDEQAYKALMTANIQSKTLSEVEEAEGIRHMLDAYEWTQERVAKEFGKSQVWVNRRLDLLNLGPEIQQQIITRVITATHGREIAQAPQEQQAEVARKVVEEKLSTRETADVVRQIKEPFAARAAFEQTIRETDGKLDEPEIQARSESPQIEDSSNNHEIQDGSTELKIQTESFVLNTDEEQNTNLVSSSTEHEIHVPLNIVNATAPATRVVSRKIKASDYITKFYEFLANLDDETVDGIVEMDETNHFLAVIDKAQEQLNWMRSKVTKAGETNIVEFRRKEA